MLFGISVRFGNSMDRLISCIFYCKIDDKMVILVIFLVISVNCQLFRYIGSYSGISVMLVNRRTPSNNFVQYYIICTAERYETGSKDFSVDLLFNQDSPRIYSLKTMKS